MRNRIETYFNQRMGRFLVICAAVGLTILSAPAAEAQTLCDSETVTGWGTSGNPIRINSNHIQTYGQSWTSGDYYLLWTPYEEAWQQFNGNAITGGLIYHNTPGNTAQSNWSNILDVYGSGSYRDYSNHWFVPNCTDKTTLYIGYTTGNSLSIVRPTINGVSAFWWLGSGILSDHGYYAQSTLTASPNGASGSPYWSAQTVGGGSVSLNCSVCASNIITSTAPSAGCNNYDVTIYASYGGFKSDPFKVFINKPAALTIQPSCPTDAAWGTGYKSVYLWLLTDTCGRSISGLDANEKFGPWTDDYFLATGHHNAWPVPTATGFYLVPGQYVQDTIGATATTSPPSAVPGSPPSTVKVMHDYPWTLYIGTQTFGSGVAVHVDTQQWYVDHGRHY